jgi:hypothetical protein
MGVRPTGMSISGVGIQWEYMETQRDVANAILLLLSDRRLLDPSRHTRPEIEAQYCYQSAQYCREELSRALKRAKPTKLPGLMRSQLAG